jgi:thiol-disulfide isomerase/thioredoxin
MDFRQRRTWLILGLAAISSYLFLLAPLSSTLPVGSVLPAVTAELADGELIDLAREPRGVFVLSFWAVWCGPCRREAPVLNRLHARGVRVIGLGVDDKPPGELLRDAQSIGIAFPVGRPSPRVIERLRVSVVPTTYVIDAQGTIVLAQTGEVSERDLTRAIDRAGGR